MELFLENILSMHFKGAVPTLEQNAQITKYNIFNIKFFLADQIADIFPC